MDHSVVKTEDEGQAIKRRRQCSRCRHRWNTYECMANAAEELAKLKHALVPVAELMR